MIKAKFVKAFVTEAGITYTLKGEKNKEVLRSAVDLQDENCIIDLAEGKAISPPDEDTKNLMFLIESYGKKRYEEGIEAGLQEERGEQK